MPGGQPGYVFGQFAERGFTVLEHLRGLVGLGGSIGKA